MSDPQYLSSEWKAEQWQAFEEEQIGDDTSDCGGWGWDPPCGGCSRCMGMQFGHYLMLEEQAVHVLQRAGFEVAAPGFIKLDWSGHHEMPYHDSWHCFTANEKSVGAFPWERAL